ncbi:MAG: DUF6603 domain-containing protein [Solirubrobacteraceae bacterium]
MSLTITLDPNVAAVLRTVGLFDADDHLVAEWFQDPMARVRTVLSDPVQRAALKQVLDDVLGSAAGAPAGVAWHPLLEDSPRGNVFLTVAGEVVGVAAQVSTPADASPRASLGVRLPLVDASGTELRAIAATADGPLELALDLELDPPAPVTAVRVGATVDLDGDAALRFVLEGVDAGSGPQTLTVSSADFGRDVARAVETLVRDAIGASPAAGADLTVDHLLGLLGLDGGAGPTLDLDALLADPGAALRAFLAQVAATPATLNAWVAHLAGLTGAPAPTANDPLAVTLVDLGDVEVVLRVEAAGGELRLALGVRAIGAPGSVEANATLLALPLTGTAPVRLVPRAAVVVRAPGTARARLVDAAPAISVGGLRGGLAFDGTALVPELVATDVVLEGTTYPSLDLTSVTALTGVATATLRQALEDALGDAGPALSLLALLGIVAPRGDPTTPHLVDLAALAQGPTRALAAVHRGALGDMAHPWEHLFAELALLLGLTGAVDGTGADDDPWRVAIAADGALELDLAAWDAPNAGDHRLRLGLLARATAAPWAAGLRAELLAFDLPASGPGPVALIGEQRLELALDPVPDAPTAVGVTLRADALRAVAAWRPGAPLTATARIEGVRAEDETGIAAGPVTLAFPPADPSAPDLGLGAGIDELLDLLRLLARHALRAWGGDGAAAAGELLGIGGDGPQLAPPDPADLGSLLERPGDALREHLRALAPDLDPDGEPYARRALELLTALVRDEVAAAADGFLPRATVAPGGAGTYAVPWNVPLADGLDVLAWLEPAGPPAAWAARLAARLDAATSGAELLALVPELRALLADLPPWLDAELDGAALDDLRAWLAGGDGVAPLAAQLPALPGWAQGPVLTAPHDALPRDARAIAAIAAQLDAWADEDGGRAVLLVGPAWTDHTAWDDLLAAVEPGRPAGAHVDLRAAGSTNAAVAALTTVATHYTADLADDGSGDLDGLTRQIAAVAERIAALTGRSRVVLVAHSTAGVAARIAGGARPDLVRGVVTLGTPHVGGAPAPLSDPRLAEAVRAARALGGGALAGTITGAVLERLDAGLDGLAGSYPAAAFAPAPDGTSEPLAALALGSAAGGDLVATLARHLATRLQDAVAAIPPADAPTHLGLGLRARLAVAGGAADDPALDLGLRVDATRVRFAPAGAPEPARPRQAVTVSALARRRAGWLAGAATGPGPRVRAAEREVVIAPGAAVAPDLRLYDVVLGGAARHDVALADPDVGAALDALLAALGPPAAGTPHAALVDLATAAGVVRSTAGGTLRADTAGLAALAAGPAARLRARRGALLDALAAAAGGALAAPAGLPLAVTYDRTTDELRMRTAAPLPFGDGVAAALDARLGLPALIPAVDAQLRVGAVTLTADPAAGTVAVSAPPWLAPPLTILPAPAPAQLRATLEPLLPRVALSAGVSAVLGALLQERGSVKALDPLLADPGAFLVALDGTEVHALLQAAARAVGADDSQGLPLPGGFVIAASGAPDIRLELRGTLDLDAAGDELRLGVALDIAPDRSVEAGGDVTVDVGLPGTWGRLAARFALTSTGVELAVTPDGAPPITLLPHFSGFGSLVQAGATALLPHLLQAIVDELRPAAGAPAGLLAATLDLAEGLGIYADDAQGFEAPARVQRLAAMLAPGWLEAQVTDPTALAQLVADVARPLLPAAAGAIARSADRLTWTLNLPAATGGQVTAEVRLGAPARVVVGLTAFDAGPLVIETARLGFDGALAFDVAVRLDPDGELAFLTPTAELGADTTGRLTAGLLPLGAARRADLELVLAPAPALTATGDGILGLIVDWGLPLVAMLGLRAAEDVLEDALWTNGPTARDVLDGSGLVVAGSSPPQLARPLPPLDAVALGALQALATGITVGLGDTLDVAIVDDGAGRKGIRLTGHAEIDTETLDVSVRFGEADWLDDADRGVTLWLLRPAAGLPPVALDPGLDLIGVGAMLSAGAGAPDATDKEALLKGPLTIGSAGALVFLRLDLLDAAGAPDVTVSDLGAAIDLRDARIALDSDDGDSIVQKLLPKELAAGFDVAVEARQGRDVELHGGIGPTPGAIELTFPLDLDFGGVVHLDEVFLSAARAAGATTLVAAISGGAELGPLAVAITRVGLRARLSAAGAQLGFKAPDGLGLSIDSSTLRLGGFLLVDEAHGRYVGAVEIAIVEKFSLVAIGIITTKNPDGTPGFSLLFLLAITFPVPIPLGYGFFFAGAGGLLGLNRGIDLDRLRLGLRAGTADSILFPTDVVARIDAIVRDLEEVFPVAPGRFLVAPMAMITYSTPPLVTAKVGLIIEIGSPLRLAILGALRVALPTPDAAVLDLKVAFLGAIDIPGAMLSFDASIYDSYLGYDDFKLSLEGDIALRVTWGAQPDFVVSVGGFHPSFHPGAHLRLPPMRRMSVSLLKDNPRITLSTYFALTTNTAQIGAKLELVFKIPGFSIEGEAGFDVLLQFVPLKLQAHIYARLAVLAGDSELLTISLDLNLEGPAPWIARGKGKFKVLFVSVEVELEARSGDPAPAVLPEVAVLAKLLEALSDDAAWSAQLSPGASELVQLRPPEAGALVLDAAGLLTVSQRVVPLGMAFSLVGTSRPNDVRRVDVLDLRIGAGTNAADTRPVTDAFAPAAYQALSDADKLAAPAFEQRQSGVQALSGDALATDGLVVYPVGYEALVYDAAAGTSTPAPGVAPSAATFTGLATGGAVAASAGARAAARRVERRSVRDVGPAAERFAVARIGELVALGDDGGELPAADPAALLSQTDAQERREALIARGIAADLQLLPEAQLAA